MTKFVNNHSWVTMFWFSVIIILYLLMLALGAVNWILTGDFYKSIFYIAYSMLGITGVAFIIHSLYSINIFKIKTPTQKLGARAQRSLMFMSALGLYLGVVGGIFLLTSYILLNIVQLPYIIAFVAMVAEFIVFSIVGYIGFSPLRNNSR